MSTDKVDSEVPSPVGGYLTEILVPRATPSTSAPCSRVIGDAAGGAGAGAAPPRRRPAAEPRPSRAPPAEAAAGAEPSSRRRSAPAPGRRPSRAGARRAEAPAPSRRTAAAPAAAPAPAPPPVDGADGMRAVAGRAPADRRARPRPDQITGTGAGGRITRDDVAARSSRPAAAGRRRRAGAGRAAPRPHAAAAPRRRRPGRPPRPGRAAPRRRPASATTAVPFNNIRRRTAEHMVRRRQTSAHVLTVDRGRLRERRAGPPAPRKDEWKAEEGFSLTYLPFIARARGRRHRASSRTSTPRSARTS